MNVKNPEGSPLPAEKWVWKLFTGEAYPYIRRTLKHQKGAPPTDEEIRGKFDEVYRHSTVKIMVIELVGMLLEFQELAIHPYGSAEFSGLMSDPFGSLSKRFGGGKYKISFYYGDQFVATQNFKVGGAPKWNMMKFLISLINAMEQKAKAAHLTASSFAQLIEQLTAHYQIGLDGGKMHTPQLLRLIQCTAGSQYEDYISILLDCPEHDTLIEHLIDELQRVHQTRHPA